MCTSEQFKTTINKSIKHKSKISTAILRRNPQQINVKLLKIRTPKKFAVITLKFEQDSFTED